MNKDNATKRPWNTYSTMPGINPEQIQIVSEDYMRKIAVIPWGKDLSPIDYANAQLIVKAVNCHDELVEALKTLVYNCECIIETEGLQVLGLEIAKQALAKCGEL